MRFWNRSLIARLVSSFLILALVAVSAVPAIAYILARQAITQSVYDRLEVAATLKEEELNRWVEDSKSDVLTLSQSPDFRTNIIQLLTTSPDSLDYQLADSALSNYLSSWLQTKSSLEEIFIINSQDAKVIASTQPTHRGDIRITYSYFSEGLKGTYIENVYISTVTGKPSMTISTPIDDLTGNLIGVLAVNLNLQRLDQIITQRTGLGQTGDTYLVNKYNTFVSEARFTQEEYPQGVHTIGIDSALQGISGKGIYNNYQGITVLGVYHWIADRNLALLAEIQQKEALAPASQLALIIFSIGLGVVLLLGVVAVTVSRQIARPILAITNTASKVAQGDLNQKAPIMTQDEIGALANTFNQMTEQLRGMVGTLEDRVTERTQQLEKRAVQLQAAAEVGGAVTTYRNLDDLLPRVTQLISERFGFYHVGIFLLDASGEYAVLRASNSEGGKRMLARGHKLAVGQTGIVGYVSGKRVARIALNVGQDAVYFDNPDLPDTRSEIALPLISADKLLGVLDVQSVHESALTQEDTSILQLLADQIAVAIQNADLFTETQAALESARRAYGEISRKNWMKILQKHPDFGYVCDQNDVTRPVSSALVPDMTRSIQDDEIGEVDGRTMVFPLIIQGRTYGKVRLRKSANSENWNSREIEFMKSLVEHLGEALDSAQLYTDSQRRAIREQLIGEVTTTMRESLDVDTVLRTAVTQMRRALNLANVEVRLQRGTEQGNNDPSRMEKDSNGRHS